MASDVPVVLGEREVLAHLDERWCVEMVVGEDADATRFTLSAGAARLLGAMLTSAADMSDLANGAMRQARVERLKRLPPISPVSDRLARSKAGVPVYWVYSKGVAHAVAGGSPTRAPVGGTATCGFVWKSGLTHDQADVLPPPEQACPVCWDAGGWAHR